MMQCGQLQLVFCDANGIEIATGIRTLSGMTS
jgi:hypothetical protein